MPADMVLVISYNRIYEHTRGCEKIVNIKSIYNDVTTIIEKQKQNQNRNRNQNQNSCLEMFRLW
jgi:hypothetical protein